MEFPLAMINDEEGDEIKTFIISAQKFGELAHTSKDAEGGQNTVFQEFKEKDKISEVKKNEGFWNKLEGIFHRRWK